MTIYTDINQVLAKFGKYAVELLLLYGFFEVVEESERSAKLTDEFWQQYEKQSKKKNTAIWALLAASILPSVFRKAGKAIEKQAGDVLTKKSRDALAREYLQARGGVMIKQMSRTDVKRMKQILLNDWYMDEKELARRLANSGICSENRGKMIVRTERHTAQQWGGFYYADDLGAIAKTWATVGDRRVRASHQVLNGETVLIRDAFSNGRFLADEIRCRCRIMYLFEGDVDSKLLSHLQKNEAPVARLPKPGVPTSGYSR